MLAATSAAVVAALIFALFWFAPWKLFTNQVVDEPLPVAAASTSAPASAAAVRSSDAMHSGAMSSSDAMHSGAMASSEAKHSGPAMASSDAMHSGSAMASPEAMHSGSAMASSDAMHSSGAASSSAPAKPVAPAGPTVLASGTLISQEHETSGSVRLVKLANGSRVITLEGLRTSNGPALHVWLTDAAVVPGESGWKVFDDGKYLDLGDLKGNIGNQVYSIPDGVDLGGYSSVSIWCERFSVSFGAAALVG